MINTCRVHFLDARTRGKERASTTRRWTVDAMAVRFHSAPPSRTGEQTENAKRRHFHAVPPRERERVSPLLSSPGPRLRRGEMKAWEDMTGNDLAVKFSRMKHFPDPRSHVLFFLCFFFFLTRITRPLFYEPRET